MNSEAKLIKPRLGLLKLAEHLRLNPKFKNRYSHQTEILPA